MLVMDTLLEITVSGKLISRGALTQLVARKSMLLITGNYEEVDD